MRTAILFFAENNRDKLLGVVQGLAEGIETQGYHVDIIDGERDVNSKLTIYNYIALGTVATSPLGGKISDKIQKYLANAGIVAGKRSLAFIYNKGLRPVKTLSRLMKVMEHEGMFLKFSEVFNSPEEARELGKRLHISA